MRWCWWSNCEELSVFRWEIVVWGGTRIVDVCYCADHSTQWSWKVPSALPRCTTGSRVVCLKYLRGPRLEMSWPSTSYQHFYTPSCSALTGKHYTRDIWWFDVEVILFRFILRINWTQCVLTISWKFVTCRRGEAEFRSDNMTAISILKDTLTKEATTKSIRLQVSCGLHLIWFLPLLNVLLVIVATHHISLYLSFVCLSFVTILSMLMWVTSSHYSFSLLCVETFSTFLCFSTFVSF